MRARQSLLPEEEEEEEEEGGGDRAGGSGADWEFTLLVHCAGAGNGARTQAGLLRNLCAQLLRQFGALADGGGGGGGALEGGGRGGRGGKPRRAREAT